MNGAVDDDEVVGSSEGSKEAEVRLVAGWKEERRWERQECGERRLQGNVVREVAGDKTGGASPESRGGCCVGCGALKTGITGKAEVVIRTEGDKWTASQVDVDS